MKLNKEQAIDILERFDFFQGQRAGRELWNDKPFDVQEQDITKFSRDVALLKEYIKELTEDVERVSKQCGDIIVECDERDAERLKQVAELTEENERLRAENEKAQIFSVFPKEEELKYLNALERMAQEYKTVRADTVRKMQAEIEARCIKGGIYPAFVKRTIDRIAEELIRGIYGNSNES